MGIEELIVVGPVSVGMCSCNLFSFTVEINILVLQCYQPYNNMQAHCQSCCKSSCTGFCKQVLEVS